MRSFHLALFAAIFALLCVLPATASARTTDDQVLDATAKLMRQKFGPTTVIVTMTRGDKTSSVLSGSDSTPSINDHMRLASVTKAYTGAVVLRLVDQEAITLDETVGRYLPSMPAAWHAVTVRQLLNHTSGIPDYTKSDGFFNQFATAPTAKIPPELLIDWVRNDPLLFAPGSKYEYSNTDNIIAAMIAEVASGRKYPDLLKTIIFNPLKLKGTSLPTGLKLPKPFMAGFTVTEADAPPFKGIAEYTNVTSALSPTGAWASGGIVSTPKELGTFIRALLKKRFFSTRVQKQQLKWVKGGASSPAGPGKNSAGLSIFRYQTRCGTVYGHTGNFPGYTQFAASNAAGTRSVTTSLDIPAPTGKTLRLLRDLQSTAVCRVLGK